jgi:hypothetical protein
MFTLSVNGDQSLYYASIGVLDKVFRPKGMHHICLQTGEQVSSLYTTFAIASKKTSIIMKNDWDHLTHVCRYSYLS